MRFLLDANVCSVHLKKPSGLLHRFQQHSGGLVIAIVVLGEHYSWAFHRSNTQKILRRIETDLLPEVAVLDFDHDCALEFGRINGSLLSRGITRGAADLMIAATALVHDLTLVTHNTADFVDIPDLRIVDWLAP